MNLGCIPPLLPLKPNVRTRGSTRCTCGGAALVSGHGSTTRCRAVAPAAANRDSPVSSSQRTDPQSPSTAVPPIPIAVQERLVSARRSWLNRCVDAPLVDSATNSRVHVYGNVHFAPLGGPGGLAELQELVSRVRPTVVAIEQPYDLSARAGLPYPEIIHHLAALLPDGAQLLAGHSDSADADAEMWDSFASRYPPEAVAAAAMEEAERLRALLPGLAQPARVGRDLLDPFEVFGLYGGCDYVTRPAQLAEALALFGHLPGLEYAALAAAAAELGVQVYSVDAPLRLQEKWVAQLVAEFTLGEADLSRRLQYDLARAQALLPEQYLEWDAELAEAVRQMELERLEEQRRLGSAGSAASSSDGPSLSTITAFKVSRAVAAAALPYELSRDALALQAGLQPLKFSVIARKARHLVLQVRDLCQRMSVRHVRVDAEALKSGAAGAEAGKVEAGSSSGAGRSAQAALVDASAQPEKVVLAIVGRQYVQYIEDMWANERSALWHGDVPRTFAPSKIDEPGSSYT